MWTFIEASIALLGVSATVLSLYAARVFHRADGNPLSRPIAWTLVGEGMLGGMTTIFATLALFGQYQLMPPEIAAMMRTIMFGVAAATTWKLVSVVKVIRGE